jgi:predicted transcriptional regulator with HTH domain
MIDNNLVGFVEESGRKLFYITDEGKKAVEILEKAYSIVAKIVAKINGY